MPNIELEDYVKEAIKCIKSQKLSYKEFEEYYDWLVELLKEKQVNLDLLKEFVEALNNNVIANVNRENNINIDKYKKHLVIINVVMDSLKENGIDTEEIWEICENVFFSVNGVKNANKR